MRSMYPNIQGGAKVITLSECAIIFANRGKYQIYYDSKQIQTTCQY